MSFDGSLLDADLEVQELAIKVNKHLEEGGKLNKEFLKKIREKIIQKNEEEKHDQ